MEEKRKRIWIHPFQSGLFIRICTYCLIYQVASWAFFALCAQLDGLLGQMHVQGTLLGNTMVRSLLAFAILVPPLTLDAVRFAHRLVGPLFRFRKTMQAIAAGEPVSLVKLRDRDLLFDFQDDFNAMLMQLERQGLVLIRKSSTAVDVDTLHSVAGMAPAAIDA